MQSGTQHHRTSSGHLQIVTNLYVNETYVLYQCGTTAPDADRVPAGSKFFEIPLTSVTVVETIPYAYLVRPSSSAVIPTSFSAGMSTQGLSCSYMNRPRAAATPVLQVMLQNSKGCQILVGTSVISRHHTCIPVCIWCQMQLPTCMQFSAGSKHAIKMTHTSSWHGIVSRHHDTYLCGLQQALNVTDRVYSVLSDTVAPCGQLQVAS